MRKIPLLLRKAFGYLECPKMPMDIWNAQKCVWILKMPCMHWVSHNAQISLWVPKSSWGYLKARGPRTPKNGYET